MLWAPVGKLANVMHNAVIFAQSFLQHSNPARGHLQPSPGPLAEARDLKFEIEAIAVLTD